MDLWIPATPQPPRGCLLSSVCTVPSHNFFKGSVLGGSALASAVSVEVVVWSAHGFDGCRYVSIVYSIRLIY